MHPLVQIGADIVLVDDVCAQLPLLWYCAAAFGRTRFNFRKAIIYIKTRSQFISSPEAVLGTLRCFKFFPISKTPSKKGGINK